MFHTLGGKTILSEFPELCGVEQSLIDRCTRKEVGDHFIQLMRDYAARAKAVRSGFDMNPSPGNIKDGLVTDAMKSAGAAREGGTSPVTAVLDSPEYSTKPGLNLQCTPGNDVERLTAQVAGGLMSFYSRPACTPTGNLAAPVIKISTNSILLDGCRTLLTLMRDRSSRGRRALKKWGSPYSNRSSKSPVARSEPRLGHWGRMISFPGSGVSL